MKRKNEIIHVNIGKCLYISFGKVATFVLVLADVVSSYIPEHFVSIRVFIDIILFVVDDRSGVNSRNVNKFTRM